MTKAHRTAGILSIGDELTLGQSLDTNSHWLAQRLLDIGIKPIEHVTVPDDLDAHVRVLQRLAATCDLVISTGGLGPTADDLTRAALARASDDELIEDPVAVAQIERWFAKSGRALNAINRVQALRPSRGECLENEHGTAPGLWGRVGEVELYCLPGPPREMKPIFEKLVRPRLRPMNDRLVRTLVLPTIGLGESDVALKLGELMRRDRAVMVGTTASKGVVSVRLRYEGDPAHADAQVRDAEAQVRERLGPIIFKHGEVSLAAELLGLLREQGLTLATVESCTGGLLGGLLTDVPGSSAVYTGGWVTYSNAMKQSLVGVDASILSPSGPGAVSAACAAAMARGGLARSGASLCVSITGIAGPDGGSEAKPVGTVWIAFGHSSDAAVEARRFVLAGDRANVREWACVAALAMIRQRAIGDEAPKLLREQERVTIQR
jgi:nicotinamide-nucleotide amidase